MTIGRLLLVAGAAMSLAASLAHLAAIAGGPSWFRWLGAGERIARGVEMGHKMPIILTIGIAAALLVFALAAFSGAGLVRPIPLTRVVLVFASAVYLARGMALFAPQILRRPDLSPTFMVVSSAIVLAMGIAYAVGTGLQWPQLSNQGTT
ncbi:MAG: hypothetical protein ABIO29_05640 [Sphingomicrobium sp.]